jgi:integrase
VHHHHWVLSAALKYARRKRLVTENVLEEVDPPKPTRYEPVMLNPKEVERLVSAAQEYGSPYYQMIYTAIYSGLRRGELLGLRWRDVNLDLATLMEVQTLQRVKGEFILKEPKTAKSRRNLALTPNLAILLRQHRDQQEEQRALLGFHFVDTDLAFSHFDGSPLDPSTVSHTCKKIVTRAGLESRLHDNRHAFATLMMSFGVNPKVVSEMLGHSTIATTMDTYSHVSLGLQRDAAKALQNGMEKYRMPDTVLEPSVN